MTNKGIEQGKRGEGKTDDVGEKVKEGIRKEEGEEDGGEEEGREVRRVEDRRS